MKRKEVKLSLHRVSRVKIIKYLYSARTGKMDSYITIDDWHPQIVNYDNIRYRVRENDYGVIVGSSLERREFIMQYRRIF